ncbi:hypothetical protein CEXT_401371 [Caerostris extrusa]|uniref:Uncharacterized protein n=1 Tax=Caerostris extrusa TaxID=172846 RepID=A0AAV4PQ25_CAEEX|nr:hypothetical protein CEXT_401371 [Caerostris extrusa]
MWLITFQPQEMGWNRQMGCVFFPTIILLGTTTFHPHRSPAAFELRGGFSFWGKAIFAIFLPQIRKFLAAFTL